MIPGQHYLNSNDPRCPDSLFDSREWNTLLINDHVTSAALDFLNSISPRDSNDNADMSHYDVTKYKHKLAIPPIGI